MESFASIANSMKTHHVNNMTCTQHVTNHAFNKEKAYHVNMTCTSYEQLPKREYGLLLRQMENWGIVAPKAIVKKYGVFLVKRAIEYTKATPNVRNNAGYMTYMLQQFKKEMEQAKETKKEVASVKEEEKQNIQPEATRMPKNERKKEKGLIVSLPTITNWKEANKFLWELENYDLENEKVIEFVRKIKKEYNFA